MQAESNERFIINFWLRFFDTRKETILKSLSYSYYANPTPNVRHISWCLRSQFIFAGPDPKNLTTVEYSTLWQKNPFSAPMAEAQLSACMVQPQILNWLVGPQLLNTMVGPQLNLFQNLPNSQPISSRHDVIHNPVTFPIWGLLHEHKLHQLTTHLNS